MLHWPQGRLNFCANCYEVLKPRASLAVEEELAGLTGSLASRKYMKDFEQ